jgi:hypothetical protein
LLKRGPERTLAQTDKPVRAPRKKKPIPAEEYQSPITTFCSVVPEDQPMNITREELLAIIDETLVAANKERKTQEDDETTEELESLCSLFAQRRPISSSGSPAKSKQDART